MKYRKLSPTGDSLFGQQQANFHINTPEGVAQAVFTRLRLQLGEWFLDTSDGMDWKGSVLGVRTSFVRDAAIRVRAFNTTGVVSIDDYGSGFDPNTRQFTAQFSLTTTFGVFGILRHAFVNPNDPVAPRLPITPYAVRTNVLSDSAVQVTWDTLFPYTSIVVDNTQTFLDDNSGNEVVSP